MNSYDDTNVPFTPDAILGVDSAPPWFTPDTRPGVDPNPDDDGCEVVWHDHLPGLEQHVFGKCKHLSHADPGVVGGVDLSVNIVGKSEPWFTPSTLLRVPTT